MKTQKDPNNIANLQAYLLVVLTRLAKIEAKIDELQHDICGDAGVTRLGFLDPKRLKTTEQLARFRLSETVRELSKYGASPASRRKRAKDQL
jgi:hypothetical protein